MWTKGRVRPYPPQALAVAADASCDPVAFHVDDCNSISTCVLFSEPSSPQQRRVLFPCPGRWVQLGPLPGGIARQEGITAVPAPGTKELQPLPTYAPAPALAASCRL